eukprot:6187281-Pleurochrysis_carterae.AAC.1
MGCFQLAGAGDVVEAVAAQLQMKGNSALVGAAPGRLHQPDAPTGCGRTTICAVYFVFGKIVAVAHLRKPQPEINSVYGIHTRKAGLAAMITAHYGIGDDHRFARADAQLFVCDSVALATRRCTLSTACLKQSRRPPVCDPGAVRA